MNMDPDYLLPLHCSFFCVCINKLASKARLFRAVAELYACESRKEKKLLSELLKREKSLVAFKNVIVTWDPESGFIALIRLPLTPYLHKAFN